MIAEESEKADETAYEIMKRLIGRKAQKFVTERVINRVKERTCCLESDGGKKIC